jgi:hypothetical protein
VFWEPAPSGRPGLEKLSGLFSDFEQRFPIATAPRKSLPQYPFDRFSLGQLPVDLQPEVK